MRTVTSFRGLREEPGPLAVAAGFFDGLHVGHRALLDRTVRRARALGGRAWALTFDTHPLKILNPAAAPPLLTCHRHKLVLLRRLGLDGCVALRFTPRLAALTAEEFIERVAAHIPPIRELLAGSNWRFGRGGQGTPALFARLTRERGLRVCVMRPLVRDGETVSSTRVRAAVLRGNLQEASRLLGRPFSLWGTVTPGRSVGRELGFPTANLDAHNEALPPRGVYAAQILLGRGRLYDGVVNLGLRPTFGRNGANRAVIEAHILDLSRDLYGRGMEVFLMGRLRAERAFRSTQALRAQIALDADAARARLRSTRAAKKVKECLYRQTGGSL